MGSSTVQMDAEPVANTAVARRYVVAGRVQGVGFRYHTREMAWQCAITGRVRNLANGTVEVVACGTREHLEGFEHWLRHGPPLARVDDLCVEAIDDPEFTDFDIGA